MVTVDGRVGKNMAVTDSSIAEPCQSMVKQLAITKSEP